MNHGVSSHKTGRRPGVVSLEILVAYGVFSEDYATYRDKRVEESLLTFIIAVASIVGISAQTMVWTLIF